jgi:Membrane bound beta barrel domain (DUF5777)
MKILVVAILLLTALPLLAQDDLMKELEQSQKPQTEYVTSTFKGTRLVNGQSVQTKGQGELEFIFAHRFGPMNSGIYNLYGLDMAYVRLGLEYGITDKLGVSIGRNSFDKTMDSYIRYRLLTQCSGARNMPVTITLYGNAACKTSPQTADATYPITFEDRMAYVGQMLIARKFSSRLSLQLMPSIVHKNTVDQTIEYNDQYAMGVGGRIRLTRSVSLTSEYYYRLNVHPNNPYQNALGFGIDIETGGHVFQLVMTNTQGLTERSIITETQGKFLNGGIHLGFNVTRTFQVRKRK